MSHHNHHQNFDLHLKELPNLVAHHSYEIEMNIIAKHKVTGPNSREAGVTTVSKKYDRQLFFEFRKLDAPPESMRIIHATLGTNHVI